MLKLEDERVWAKFVEFSARLKAMKTGRKMKLSLVVIKMMKKSLLNGQSQGNIYKQKCIKVLTKVVQFDTIKI